MAKLIRATSMVGTTYNDLTVVAADGVAPRKARVVCKCGKEFFAVPNEVRMGHTKSCGCRNNRLQAKDRIGQKFGRLTIKERTDVRKEVSYLCDCECGETTTANWGNLRAGNTKSCGCLKQLSGDSHYNRLPLSEVKLRLAELAPQYTFPNLDEEWKGTQGSVITMTCADHGTFAQKLHANGSSKGFFAGQVCKACGYEKAQASFARGISKPEIELSDFIATMTPVTRGCLPQTNQWTFDIIIPELKIAVEFNGVYWHSFPIARRGQHVHKRKFAEKHGYRMISIWEDTWTNDRPKVEKFFTRIIEGSKSIGARKLIAEAVDRHTANEFHILHHLQGEAPTAANNSFCLKDGSGAIFAVVSFDKKGVLHRYTVGSVSVLGGLNKLIKFSGIKDIVTYCDRDHFTGGVYLAAGFEKTGHTMQLTYVLNRIRVRRERFMKKNLTKVFGDVDMSKTEHEICAEHGVRAAYNSGIDRYELHL